MDKLKPGQLAIVKEVNVSGYMGRRFLYIGLIENTKFECIRKSPVVTQQLIILEVLLLL